MADKDSKDIATTSAAYDMMLPHWQKIATVLEGTAALRAAGRTYLPQHAAEDNDVYDERLARATLYNLSKLTLDSWVGRPFSDPVKWDELPAEVEEMLDNVDQQGDAAQVFLRNWFKDGLAKAFSHVLVDMPRITTVDPDVPPRTAADDGDTPYWVLICPEQVFFAQATYEGGREVLQEVRIMEQIVERRGYAEVHIPQIRVITPGHVQLWQPSKQKNAQGKARWILKEEYDFDLQEVPLVTFYSDRQGFMLGKSAIEDLVDLNIAHWQSMADQTHTLTVARFPILAGSGVEGDLVIGPNKYLTAIDPAAKFYYVEHTGAAIAAGRTDLEALETQMAEYGAEFLKKRPGSPTATARALDSAEATSPLQDATIRFMEATQQVVFLTERWLGLEEKGTVLLPTEFGPEISDPGDMDMLKTARTLRDISRVAFLKELQRRGIMHEDFDPEEDAALLQDEAMELPMPDDDEPDDPDDEKKPGEEDDDEKPGDKRVPPAIAAG